MSKMGRHKTLREQRDKAFSIDQADLDYLDAIKQSLGISRSHVLRCIIRDFQQRNPDPATAISIEVGQAA